MSTSAQASLYPDVRLVETAPDGLRLTFEPTAWQLDSVARGEITVTFAGAQWSTEPQAPALPQRSILVAVPPEGEVFVEAVPQAWQTVSNRPAQRRPALRASRAGEIERLPQAPPLLRWDGPFWSRNIRLVRIWLAPVQPVSGGLVSTPRVDVRVRWDGAAGTSLREPLFESIYRNTILNFEQARSFARAITPAQIDNPFAGGSEWYEVTVRSDGIQRLTFAQLNGAGFPVGSANPQDFRLFYSGGKMLPVRNTDPRPEFKEIPILVQGEGDGSFDPADVIYFFGQGPNRWENNDSDAVYVINQYTRDVVYWLTPSGSYAGAPQRVIVHAAAPGADPATVTAIGRATAEQNKLLNLDIDDYYTWFWEHGDTLTALLNLKNSSSLPGEIAITARPTLRPSNAQVTVNGVAATYQSESGSRSVFTMSQWWPTTTVEIVYTSSGEAWFDRVEAIYPLGLAASLGVREFWLPAGSGNRARITGVPDGAALWDITAADSPFVVSGAPSSDMLDFDPGAFSSERRFRLWTPVEAIQPASVVRATPGQLRQSPPAADMLIVYHPSLRAPLDAYKTHRETYGGISVDLVDVTDIYRDFGFGMFDPVAIRDFLKYAYEHATTPPVAALLVGDGNYDFLDVLGTGTPNYIPPFIVEPVLDETAGDQNYVSFGRLGTLDVDTSWIGLGDRGWDMMIARWPVRDATETQIVANKVVAYETEPELGLWRNRVVLVADDEYGEYPSTSEFFHTVQAEGIDKHIPATFDRTKIYLFEYGKDAAGEKPGAREDLVNAWNEGMVYVDYVGHGSPDVWAHEDVFRRTRDLPRLFNGQRLPLVYTASCSIGFFDEPTQQGMGEELFRRAAGGAIAIISATRLVFSQPNIDLNEAVLDFMLGPTYMSVGEALFAGLISRQYSTSSGPVPLENDRKHILMGDPFMHLAHPHYDATLTLTDTNGMAQDSFVALRPMRVTGEVVDSSSQPLDLGGNLLLSVRDAPRRRQYQVGARVVNYTLEGRPIFAGTFPSDSAGFSLGFFVPKDVSYGEDSGRIVVYAQGTDSDALGVLAPVPVALLADSTSDSEGPIWELTINGRRPEGRVEVGPDDTWQARLADPLGINIVGGGHGISQTVDADEYTRRDLTGLFTYDVGSITSGLVNFKLTDLEPGPHEVQLLAWDNANNPGMIDVSVEATGDARYEIKDLLVYPNPFDPSLSQAQLTYELTFPPERVQLSLFTVAGHRIRTFDPPARIGFNYETRWDGRDDVGDDVAAGIYILAVEAFAAGREVKDFTKIVVVRSN